MTSVPDSDTSGLCMHSHTHSFMHTLKHSNFKERIETLNDSIKASISHPEMISAGPVMPARKPDLF